MKSKYDIMAYGKFRIEKPASDINAIPFRQKKEYNSRCSEELSNHPSLKYLTTQEAPFVPSKVSKSTIVSRDEHPTAKYLASLSQKMLYILCVEKDFTHPLVLKHIPPDFSAQQDGRTNSQSREDHFEIWASALEEMPGYGWEVVETVAEIHQSGKKAKMWTFKRLSGLFAPGSGREKISSDVAPGIVKENVGVMKWELRDDTWVCTRLKTLNGVSGVA